MGGTHLTPDFPAPPPHPGGGEAPKVYPQFFFADVEFLFRDAPPLPGEEAKYAEALSLIAAAGADPKLKAAIIDAAKRAQEELIDPLLEGPPLRGFCESLPARA